MIRTVEDHSGADSARNPVFGLISEVD